MKKYFYLLLLLLAFGASADDSLTATWTLPSSNAEGTRFYELTCSVEWVVNVCPSGVMVPTLIKQASRNPGQTDCSRAFPELTTSDCYGYSNPEYFKGRNGYACFAATAYLGEEETGYGPIGCLESFFLAPPGRLSLN